MTYNPRYFSNNQVTTPQITESAITSDKIADETIESSDIKNGAIKTEDIADKAVTLAKLGDDVPAVGIPDGSIGVTKLQSSSVTKEKIATAAVDTDELANQAVTTDKLRDGNVTGVKIASNAITTGKIATGAVGTTDIANGAVTAEKLAPGAGGGDTITFLPASLEAVYLAGQSGPLDWTAADLSAWIPDGAKAAIIQVGMFTESTTSGARADMRLRANEEQRESLGVTNKGPSQTDFNFGIVPVQNTGNRILEYRLDVTGTISVTVWITVIGYVI